jgi:hypothetical protein
MGSEGNPQETIGDFPPMPRHCSARSGPTGSARFRCCRDTPGTARRRVSRPGCQVRTRFRTRRRACADHRAGGGREREPLAELDGAGRRYSLPCVPTSPSAAPACRWREGACWHAGRSLPARRTGAAFGEGAARPLRPAQPLLQRVRLICLQRVLGPLRGQGPLFSNSRSTRCRTTFSNFSTSACVGGDNGSKRTPPSHGTKTPSGTSEWK